MNPHKLLQYFLLFAIAVPAITHGWYYVRWRWSERR